MVIQDLLDMVMALHLLVMDMHPKSTQVVINQLQSSVVHTLWDILVHITKNGNTSLDISDDKDET